MFGFLKSMLLAKLLAAKDAVLSGSGSAMIAAAAGLFDAVGAADAAANLRAAAKDLSDGDQAKLAKDTMKVQAGLVNYLLGLEGDRVVTVSATTGADGEVPHELATCICHCGVATSVAFGDMAAIFTPDQRARFAAFIAAILRGFFAGN
jgi:hypothetical protein